MDKTILRQIAMLNEQARNAKSPRTAKRFVKQAQPYIKEAKKRKLKFEFDFELMD